MRHWYLLYTKPHRVPLVHRQLEDRGFRTYFPYTQYKRGYGRGVRLEPFFPNYLFVYLDLESAEATGITWLPGVRYLVSFDDRPAEVPDSVVEALQLRLAPYADKKLDKVEMLFATGERVTVESGPLAGLEGIFQHGLNGTQRVQILLNLLGRWSRVDLDVHQLASAAKRRFALPT